MRLSCLLRDGEPGAEGDPCAGCVLTDRTSSPGSEHGRQSTVLVRVPVISPRRGSEPSPDKFLSGAAGDGTRDRARERSTPQARIGLDLWGFPGEAGQRAH